MKAKFTHAVLVVALIGAWPAATARAVTTIGIGTLGDSYTAEYDDSSARNRHRNWVEQLGNSGGLDDEIAGGPYNFGTYRHTNSPNWGFPRGQGFEYNWALSGFTTDQVIQSELPGLDAQVSNGDVGIVMIFAGVNDFGPLFTADQAALDAEVADVVANINTMVNTLRTTDPTVKIVLSTMTDRSVWPGSSGFTVQQRQNVSNAIQSANSQIVSNVHALDIPVLDAFSLMNDVLANPVFAGQAINTGIPLDDPGTGKDESAEDFPADYFWADPSHAGTVWQGIFANTFLTALDVGYGDDFSAGDLVLLDNQTIWNNAYAGPGGTPPTVTSDVFDYESYVLFPAPPLVGDYDDDGTVGQTDLDLVLTNWGVSVDDGESPDPINWLNADDVTASLIGQDELARVLQNWGNTQAILAELALIEDTTGLTEQEIIGLIPEPASAILLGGALLLVGSRRRRA